MKVVEDFAMEVPKTKEFIGITKNLNLEGKKILLDFRDEPERGAVGPQPAECKGGFGVEHQYVHDVMNAGNIVLAEGSVNVINQMFPRLYPAT